MFAVTKTPIHTTVSNPSFKPKSSFRHVKQGIQEFHRMYVLVPADKAANIYGVVVSRLHYINTLKQELGGT